MTVVKFAQVVGGGTGIDRSVTITEAIKRACYENAEGLPLAFVLGCIEIAKADILKDQEL